MKIGTTLDVETRASTGRFQEDVKDSKTDVLMLAVVFKIKGFVLLHCGVRLDFQ